MGYQIVRNTGLRETQTMASVFGGETWSSAGSMWSRRVLILVALGAIAAVAGKFQMLSSCNLAADDRTVELEHSDVECVY